MRLANINALTAADAVGAVAKGMQVFGFTKGQWGLVDIIRHIASHGQFDLTVSAWQATGEAMARLAAVPGIRSARFLIDASFPNRQPAYAWQMMERFGKGALIVTKTHAKFSLLKSDDLAIVVRTSMNLNEEQRLEMYEIDESPSMFEKFEASVAGKSAADLIKPAQGQLCYA